MSDFEVTVVPGVRVTLTMPEDGTWNGSDGQRRFLTLTEENFEQLAETIEAHRREARRPKTAEEYLKLSDDDPEDMAEEPGERGISSLLAKHGVEREEPDFPLPGRNASDAVFQGIPFKVERRTEGDDELILVRAIGSRSRTATHEYAAEVAARALNKGEELTEPQFRGLASFKAWAFGIKVVAEESKPETYFPGPGEAASTIEVDDFEFLVERLSGDRIVVSTYAHGAIHNEAARAAATLILDNEVLHTLRFRVEGDTKLWLFSIEVSPF